MFPSSRLSVLSTVFIACILALISVNDGVNALPMLSRKLAQAAKSKPIPIPIAKSSFLSSQTESSGSNQQLPFDWTLLPTPQEKVQTSPTVTTAPSSPKDEELSAFELPFPMFDDAEDAETEVELVSKKAKSKVDNVKSTVSFSSSVSKPIPIPGAAKPTRKAPEFHIGRPREVPKARWYPIRK